MARTVGQLEAVLGRHIPADEEFTDYLNMAMPRLHNMGNWRDLLHEAQYSTDHTYVALPREYENLVAGMVDGVPTKGSSRWSDYMALGIASTSGPPPLYGLIDDGLWPTMIELADGDATGDGDYTLTVVPVEPESVLPTTGRVYVTYQHVDESKTRYEFELDGSGSLSTPDAEGAGATRVEQVVFEDVPVLVELQAVPLTSGTTLSLTTGRGSEVAEHRRFRLNANVGTAQTVAMLMKRRCLDFLNPTDIVPLGGYDIVKHALLGVIAEDNANLEDAAVHWGYCESLLEDEMAAYRGSIRPNINIDPTGGAGEPTYNTL